MIPNTQNPLTAVIHELTDRAIQCSLLIASWVGLVSASLQAVAFEHCPGILFMPKIKKKKIGFDGYVYT